VEDDGRLSAAGDPRRDCLGLVIDI
jgi:hypothetical protein